MMIDYAIDERTLTTNDTNEYMSIREYLEDWVPLEIENSLIPENGTINISALQNNNVYRFKCDIPCMSHGAQSMFESEKIKKVQMLETKLAKHDINIIYGRQGKYMGKDVSQKNSLLIVIMQI